MDTTAAMAPSAPLTSSTINSSGVSDDESTAEQSLMRRLFWKNREQQTVRYLNDMFERSKNMRWRFERQWHVNLSYYFGRQWITWLNSASPDIARLFEPQAPPWRVRLTVNRIKPAVRREMSKVMKEKPTAFVIPSTTEDNDVAAAKAGEAVFEHLWRQLKMKDVMWVSQFWRTTTGTGFVKDWWDPRAPSENGKGAIRVESPSPFHLYFSNLDQPDIERQEFIIHVAMKSPEEVKAVYGMEVKADSIERSGGEVESQYLRALNLEPGNVSQVAVKEIWIKPNVRFPQGAMFVWAGDKILWSSMGPTGDPIWPLYKPEYPFTKFDGVPTGRFYGDSSIVDLLPLQKEYNRTRSQIIEAKNQMAKPQLMAPKGSIDAHKITSEPGLVIFYTPGYEKPTPLPLTPLPNYVLQELDRSLLDIADISGQHEVSSGTVPSGVTAASALSFLQEQDDTMIAPVIQALESGVERLGRHFLCHVQQYWDIPQTVKVLGPDNTWEIQQLMGSDLEGNTDLNVQAGSAMPRLLAAKQAFIMELVDKQIITPEMGLRYLEMAETGQMYEETQVDRRQAERENMKMSDPKILVPDFSQMWAAFQQSQMQSQPGSPLGLGAGADGAGMSPLEIGAGGGGTNPMQPDVPTLPAAPGLGGEAPGPGAAAPPGMPPEMMPPGMPPEMGGAPPGMGGMPGMGGETPPGVSPSGHLMFSGPRDPTAPQSPAQMGMPLPPPPPIVPVNTWDNHELHIEVHNNFRKRQEYENLEPGLKEQFERHVEMHRAALGLPPSIDPMRAHQMMTMQQLMPQPPMMEGEGMMAEGGPPPEEQPPTPGAAQPAGGPL